MPIQLAIVDGQTLIRYGLRELVAQHTDIEIVAECQSAADVLAMVARARPDVETIDVALPHRDRLLLAGELRERQADLGIVKLASQHDGDVLSRALHAGQAAY